jgi:hypothetical protein
MGWLIGALACAIPSQRRVKGGVYTIAWRINPSRYFTTQRTPPQGGNSFINIKLLNDRIIMVGQHHKKRPLN